MKLQSINPYNLEKLKTYDEMSDQDIQEILKLGQKTFESWRKTGFSERAKLFKKLSELLRKNADDYAFLITQEMGKLLTEAHAEVMKCTTACDYYAENSENFLADEIVNTKARIHYQPLGVILGIMPWNFPLWQVIRFAAPTLMAGNTCVLKHASNVTGCALALEQLFLDSGFPKGVFQILRVSSDRMSTVIENPIVQAVSLTGSTEAGKKVAALAGSHLKKCVLELGGSDPYIVCEDADLEMALDICFKSRMINAGQSCIAAKRFIIHDSLYEDFKNRLIQKMKNLETGDPMFTTTTLAPMASIKLRDELHKKVLQAVNNGATIAFGGGYPLAKGAFYNPTILENIESNNPVYVDELFGPVACLYKFHNMKKALEIANATPFGLGAGIISKNTEHALKIAQEDLEAGSCFVNDFVKSSVETPFGGIKSSGYGRELSRYGMLEFVNIKTVVV
jgi:succinate-semialdehyde dehydrogenase/glutarate-semialdehyde dehydrogenase